MVHGAHKRIKITRCSCWG